MKPQVKLRPINSNVVVQRDEPESVTEGGIILPDDAKQKQARGTVLAVGPGKYPNTKSGLAMERIPMNVQEGDRVLFNKYAGHKYDENDDSLIIMEEENISAIIG